MQLLLNLFIVGLVLSTSVCHASPVFSVDSDKFDFGEVFQGEKVPHVFTFTNAGDEVLNIDRVRSSCGCTAVLLSEKTIAPGATGEVKANFDSSRFRGNISKTIYVYSNDPVNPAMQLHLKGTVLEKVKVSPAQVNFGAVVAKEEISTRITLKNQTAGPMQVGPAKTTAEELLVDMQSVTLQAGEETTVTLTLKTKPGNTRFSGYLLVPVDDLSKNELRIPVYATIRN